MVVMTTRKEIMKHEVIKMMEERLKELEECASGTAYSAREFWDGKIEELENMIEKVRKM